jgi:NADP-dependent 3-hydroxy acid dehydrogenase YdfG
MQNSSGIKDKVVVITGASSGIGEATALLLAERGAKVVLGARGPDRLEALAGRIAASGGEAAYARTDVKRREDVSNLVGLAIERYGKLDVLVNNAGVAPISLLEELRVDDWEEMIDVNLKGVLYGIAAALPVFRRQSFGHFVNVISTAGIQIMPTMAVYAGTKNAVRTITETLRQEAGDKLRVTSVSPGFVQTNLTNSMTNPGVKAQIVERMEKMAIPPAAIAVLLRSPSSSRLKLMLTRSSSVPLRRGSRTFFCWFKRSSLPKAMSSSPRAAKKDLNLYIQVASDCKWVRIPSGSLFSN